MTPVFPDFCSVLFFGCCLSPASDPVGNHLPLDADEAGYCVDGHSYNWRGKDGQVTSGKKAFQHGWQVCLAKRRAAARRRHPRKPSS
jgi:hypothetical protein